jgi:hypothetical protein
MEHFERFDDEIEVDIPPSNKDAKCAPTASFPLSEAISDLDNVQALRACMMT